MSQLNYIEINGCKHYILNEEGTSKMFFIDSPFLVEIDENTKHPLGVVFKPKGCIDTPIRFVRQPNNSFFMFKRTEWNVKSNPFYVQKRIKYKDKFIVDIIDAFYSQESYL